MFEEGNCFWIETNPDKEGRPQGHLFVLILKCDHERIVIVNIDKIRGKKKYDTTTIIRAGEGHEFIVEDSYVNYDRAELTDVGQLQTRMAEKSAKYKDGVMEIGVLERICAGVLISDFTPYEVREVFEDRLYKSMKKSPA
jgi:hypothetical protein